MPNQQTRRCSPAYILTTVGRPDDDPKTREALFLGAALRDAGGTVSLVLVAGAPHFWDGAGDVPGIVARSADFARSLALLEV